MMLARGALFLSRSTEYEPEIYSLLFGEVLGVPSDELLPIAGLGIACIAALAVLYRPLMLTSILVEALMVMLGIGVKVSTLPVVALGVGIAAVVNYNGTYGILGAALGLFAWLGLLTGRHATA